MSVGSLYQAHVDLFPKDLTSYSAMDARRQSFIDRASQAFSDPDIGEAVVQTKALTDLFELWTDLNLANLMRMQNWYIQWQGELSKEQKLAVLFFGTFSIETLNVNVKSGTPLKQELREVWRLHHALFDDFAEHELAYFIHRIMLMCEAPLIPQMLTKQNDMLLRRQAYIHYGERYQVEAKFNVQLENDAKCFSKSIVSDHRVQDANIRSGQLAVMWKDVVDTFNLSRQFHRQIFGEQNIRPDLPC
ncbi:MAG: hypothetical protein ACPGUD_11595 [Parashewanella sp.]